MMVIDMSATLLEDAPPRLRPSGIRILAIISFLLAGYLFLSGILVTIGAISLASGRYLLGEYVNLGPLIYFLAAVAMALLGIGLDRGWRLFRRLGIIIAALFMATSLLPVSAAVTYFQIVPLMLHGVKIILAIMAIRYLLQPEVVDFFSAKGVPRSTG
jgi:hypothetical protein